MMQNKNAESTKEKEAVQMEKAKVITPIFSAKLGEGLSDEASAPDEKKRGSPRSTWKINSWRSRCISVNWEI